MAGETTSTTTTALILAKMIERKILLELRPAQFWKPLIRIRDVSAEPTKAASFPKWNLMSAAAHTEGTDDSNTAVTPTEITVTSAPESLTTEIEDIAAKSTVIDLRTETLVVFSRAVMAKFNTDAAALIAGFTNSVGVTATALTVSTMTDAVAQYNVQNAGGDGTRGLFVLYPNQVRDVQKDASLGSGAGLSPAMSRPDLISLFGEEAAESQILGANAGHFMAVPVLQTTDVPTANVGVDSAGALFTIPVGDNGQAALGAAVKWWAQGEEIRRPRAIALEMTVSAAYGLGRIDPLRGVTILSAR